MQLNLTKPLVFFDLETTGINVVTDRIVEICLHKVFPDGTTETKTYRVNPIIPIPAEASAVHGIYDKDVKDCPTFETIAKEISQFIGASDLAGFNSNKFDIPFLIEEFYRYGVEFSMKGRKTIDVLNIFHKMEPRTLKAAYQFYCNKTLANAHSAEADTIATFEILKAQVNKYSDVPYEEKDGTVTYPIKNDTTSLCDFSTHHKQVDLIGHIILNNDNKEVFNFGKHKGELVEKIFAKEPSYYDWMIKADFPATTKQVITTIKLRGFNQGNATLF